MRLKILLGFLLTILAILVMDNLIEMVVKVHWQKVTISTSAGIVVGMVLGGIISSSITKNIKKLVSAINIVSEGDLTEEISIESKDEISDLSVAFNKMIHNFKDIVINTKDISHTLYTSSNTFLNFTKEIKLSAEEVSQSIEGISRGAEQQSSLVTKSSDIMKNMAESIDSIAKKATLTVTSANNAKEIALSGENAAKSAVIEMESVFSRIDSAAVSIKNFEKGMKEIHKIVSMITNVAHQTNLLALNATIEAAKAGDYGKGFAVVADEVRKLADGSREFTYKITDIVDSIQDEHKNILSSIEASTSGVKVGREKINTIVSSLEIIVDSVIGMVKDVEEISTHTNRQSKDTENVVFAIEELSKLASDNASSTEQTAAAIEQQTVSMEEINKLAYELSHTSSRLRDAVTKFRVQEDVIDEKESEIDLS